MDGCGGGAGRFPVLDGEGAAVRRLHVPIAALTHHEGHAPCDERAEQLAAVEAAVEDPGAPAAGGVMGFQIRNDRAGVVVVGGERFGVFECVAFVCAGLVVGEHGAAGETHRACLPIDCARGVRGDAHSVQPGDALEAVLQGRGSRRNAG